MKIIKKDKEKLIFQEEITESLANAIRRSVNEILIIATDEVEFIKNDSALYDEILAHRLGLVVLKNQDLKKIEECNCKGKGCAKCSVQLKLSTKGPKTVYVGDMKGKTEVIHKKTILTLLLEGQELEFVATARIGKGIEHAKHSPGLIYYRNLAEIKIDKNCDGCLKCVKACPQDIINIENKKLKVKEEYKCDMCDVCVEACKKYGKNAIEIKPSKELVFFIESFGQISAQDILNKAIKVLKENLNQIAKKIK